MVWSAVGWSAGRLVGCRVAVGSVGSSSDELYKNLLNRDLVHVRKTKPCHFGHYFPIYFAILFFTNSNSLEAPDDTMVTFPSRPFAGILLLLGVPASAFVVIPGRYGSPGAAAQATQVLVSDATQHNFGSMVTGRNGAPPLHASSSEANPAADASIEDDVDEEDL